MLEVDELFLRSGDAYAYSEDESLILTPCENSKRGAAIYHQLFSNEGEIKVRFDYVMQGGNGADGICVALVDPSNPDWMRSGEYGGGLGYNSRPGAVVAVGFDAFGNFADGGSEGGRDGTIVVKGGEAEEYATMAQVPFGVQTEGDFRSVKIKFDLDDDRANISVKVDGEEVLKEADIERIHLPSQMAIVFTASTGGLNNLHAIKNVQLKEEFEWDD